MCQTHHGVWRHGLVQSPSSSERFPVQSMMGSRSERPQVSATLGCCIGGRDCVKSLRPCLHGTCPQKVTSLAPLSVGGRSIGLLIQKLDLNSAWVFLVRSDVGIYILRPHSYFSTNNPPSPLPSEGGHFRGVEGFIPKSQDRNMASTVLDVPHLLDSGLRRAWSYMKREFN